MIGLMQVLKWREQTLAESVSWHTMQKSLTAENTKAYTAGYEEGYRHALSALACHGHIDIDPTH